MGGKVTTSIILYKSQKKKNGKHPAKLRVTFNRKQMYYSIDSKNKVFEFTPNEFKKVMSPKPRGTNKDIQLALSLIENKAKEIIASMEDFSFKQFKSKFGIPGGELTNIIYFFERKIEEFKNNNQYVSSRQYVTAMRSLIKFSGTKRIDFRDLTANELKLYEKWFVDRGLSISMARFCIIPIRTIFNIAHREGVISKDLYPFGKGLYQIPNGQNVKKALKLNEIEKIYNYKCKDNPHREKCKDLWIFSYLMNGANINDIVRLKYKNIDNDFITFIRHKTLTTCNTPKPISVPYSNDLKRIIKKWGNKDCSPDNFIFPFIKDQMTEKNIRSRLDALIGKINIEMKEIVKDVGINKKVTTYTARHSFSTVLKRSGVSTEFIGESLGHTSLKTTELYLDSFEDDMKKDIAKHLTAFKKKVRLN